MRLRLLRLWETVRSSFWFIPSCMALAACLLATASVGLDAELPSAAIKGTEWIYGGGAEGASAVLGAVAGSMISTAGVVFSLTLVALSLTTSQFGPRLLRNFMKDQITQVTLGTFLAAFLFCLLVLRTVRRGDGVEFVPHVSVSIGVILAVASLGMLIYFIHHLASLIQADNLIARVAADLDSAIDKLYPDTVGVAAKEDEDDLEAASQLENQVGLVKVDGDGYLQVVDADQLFAAAVEQDVVIEMTRRPGDYLTTGLIVARVSPAHRMNEELAVAVNASMVRGPSRTATQDAGFLVNQLVEIAVRALSPGINDPFTASTCIDRLGSALAQFSHRRLPSPLRRDESKTVRVIARPLDFAQMTDLAFSPIRQHARTSPGVLGKLLATIRDLADIVASPEHRKTLREHVAGIAVSIKHGVDNEMDRERLEVLQKQAERALAEPPTG